MLKGKLLLKLREQQPGATLTRINTMLIPIRNKGCNPPIFVVPGAPGNLGWLIELSLLMGKEYPIYGLEPKGLKNWDERHNSIQALADYYLNLIKTIQPTGPYCLAGYSFGGTVIYEMGLQLTSQGDCASHIILLDAYAPVSKAFTQLTLPTYFPWILLGNMFGTYWKITKLFRPEDFLKLEPKQYTEYTAKYIFNSCKMLLSFADLYKLIENSVNLMLQAGSLVKNYHARLYHGKSKVFLFQAAHGFVSKSNKFLLPSVHVDMSDSDLNGWASLFTTDICAFNISCDHFELVTGNSLKKIVEQLKKHLTTSNENDYDPK